MVEVGVRTQHTPSCCFTSRLPPNNTSATSWIRHTTPTQLTLTTGTVAVACGKVDRRASVEGGGSRDPRPR